MASLPSASAADLRSRLEADFRDRVTRFYRALQITPPYHSVEKALLALREALAEMEEPALQAASADPASLDALFGHVFIESGLARKHRGIITRLVAASPDLLPPECRPFTGAFRA
jgi:hypothetical protein